MVKADFDSMSKPTVILTGSIDYSFQSILMIYKINYMETRRNDTNPVNNGR